VNQQNEDVEFEAYLRRRSRLSHRYRELGRETPPGDLDDAVLSMAREAQGIRKPKTEDRYLQWTAPVAFAATVVLVFTVVLQVIVRPEFAPAHLAGRVAEVGKSPAPSEQSTEQMAGERLPGPPAGGSSIAIPIAADELREPPQERKELAARKSENLGAVLAARPAAASSAAPGASAADASPPAPARDPKAWLKEIERLRRSGQIEAAAEQMRLFRKQFPDYFRTHHPPASAE
jgi:hypothetical protein